MFHLKADLPLETTKVLAAEMRDGAWRPSFPLPDEHSDENPFSWSFPLTVNTWEIKSFNGMPKDGYKQNIIAFRTTVESRCYGCLRPVPVISHGGVLCCNSCNADSVPNGTGTPLAVPLTEFIFRYHLNGKVTYRRSLLRYQDPSGSSGLCISSHCEAMDDIENDDAVIYLQFLDGILQWIRAHFGLNTQVKILDDPASDVRALLRRNGWMFHERFGLFFIRGKPDTNDEGEDGMPEDCVVS